VDYPPSFGVIKLELTLSLIGGEEWFEATVSNPVAEHTALGRSPGMAIGLALDKLADSFKRGHQGYLALGT